MPYHCSAISVAYYSLQRSISTSDEPSVVHHVGLSLSFEQVQFEKRPHEAKLMSLESSGGVQSAAPELYTRSRVRFPGAEANFFVRVKQEKARVYEISANVPDVIHTLQIRCAS